MTNTKLRNHNLVHLSHYHSGLVKDIKTDFQVWIKGLASNSQVPYQRYVVSFFDWYRFKSIEELTNDDLNVQNSDIINYRTFLRGLPENYKNSSVNLMLAAIQSFYKFLERNNYPVRAAWVSIDPLPDNAEHAGGLNLPEAEEMARLVLETNKGFEKSVLIEMAYITSFRKDSLLKLTLQDFKPNFKDSTIYEVKTIGKGDKLHMVYITEELYKKVKAVTELPYRKQAKSDKIFGLSKNTIQAMMDWLKTEMKIPAERNIVFHSFRGVLASFGTLEEARAHFNHSSSAITEKSYRHLRTDFSTSLSLRATNKTDTKIFEELSKEELIELILSQQPGQIMSMGQQAERMVHQKSK